jgi:hypothetical protein
MFSDAREKIRKREFFSVAVIHQKMIGRDVLSERSALRGCGLKRSQDHPGGNAHFP